MKLNYRQFILSMTAAAVTSVLAATAVQAENIKIAYIDAVSGPFAPLIKNSTNSLQMFVERANKEKWAGDNTFELVVLDGKAVRRNRCNNLKLPVTRASDMSSIRSDQGWRWQ